MNPRIWAPTILSLLLLSLAGCAAGAEPETTTDKEDPAQADEGDESADSDQMPDVEDGDDAPTAPTGGKDASIGTGKDAGMDARAPRSDASVADTVATKVDSATPPEEDPVPTPGDGGTTPPPTSTAGKLPRVDTTDGPGPFKGVTKVKMTAPGGWLIYPTDIGKDGIKHPLFVFGPGGGTTPSTYESMGMHWDRYGSYGFVIYVLPRSTGDGADMKAGLDWLIAQNDVSSSPLYQKLDITKICAAGHSQGSITTFDFMPDERVTTTIHISGGSFDGKGPDNLSKDTMFLCGPSQSADTAEPQCNGDFTNSKVPTFYTKIEGSSHLTSGRLGWASIIAWLLWHLADQEDQWKKEFVEPTGKFQTGIYKSQVKNW